MIRFLAAFAWLRFRLLMNPFKRRRRDSLEMLSALAAIVVPVAILLFFMLGALMLGVMAFLAGGSIASGRADPAPLIVAVRLLLLALLVTVLIFTMGRGAHASLAAHPRLMLLPIPRWLLHGLEVATSVADPWILIVVPGLILLPAGILRAGRTTAALVMLLAGAGFLAAIISTAALVSYTAQFLLRDRRRRELATLIGAISMILVSIALAVLIVILPEEELKALLGGFRTQIWLSVLPSEIYARVAAESLLPAPLGSLLPLAALLAEAVLLYMLSGILFRRLVGSAETGRSRSRSAAFPRFPDIPWLSPAAAGLAAVQVMSALRTIKGKMSVFTPGPLIFLFGLLLPRLPDLKGLSGRAEGHGPLLLAAAGLMCLLSVHPILMNQFAIDRSGLSLLFVSPLRMRDVLHGKAIAGAVLFAMTLAPCLAALAFLFPGGSPLLWISTLLGLIAMYVLAAPPAAILSAFFPKASDLNAMGSAGNPHALASLLGFLLTALAILPSAAITAVAGTIMDRPLLACGLNAIWAGLAGAGYAPLMRAAAILVAERRENLALTAGST